MNIRSMLAWYKHYEPWIWLSLTGLGLILYAVSPEGRSIHLFLQ